MDTNSDIPLITNKEIHNFDGQYSILEHTTGEGSLLRIKDDNSVIVRLSNAIHRLHTDDVVGLVGFLLGQPATPELVARLPIFDIPPPPVFTVTVTSPFEGKMVDIGSEEELVVAFSILRDSEDVTTKFGKDVLVEASNSASGDDWYALDGTAEDCCWAVFDARVEFYLNNVTDKTHRLRVGVKLHGADRVVYCDPIRLLHNMAEPRINPTVVVSFVGNNPPEPVTVPNVRTVRTTDDWVTVLYNTGDTLRFNKREVFSIDYRKH